jgi:sigma-B regulation protein RsbU (phosphoserine phosphatase)
MSASTPQSPEDRLELLLRLSQTLNSSLDLDIVLNRLIDEVIQATRAERGFVMLYDAAGELTFRVARGMDRSTIDDPQFQVSRGIVEQAAREGRALLASDAQVDARFSMRRSVKMLGLHAILCAPLVVKDRALGVIYVDNRLQVGVFSYADRDLLAAIAASAAVAIDNARLYEVAVEKGRLERELQMAHEVQASFLPQGTPQVPGWEFVACWRPAREVSGDYYDFIPIDGGRLGLVIADVVGKGMPAALFMVLTRSIVRASVIGAAFPAEGIAQANQLICADAVTGMFVSLFYAHLDPGTGEMTYVNAGHHPPLCYRASQDELLPLSRTGMMLGVLADTPFEQRTVRLDPGDFVLSYTDGVTDAIDAQEQTFGMERLQRTVFEQRHTPAAGLLAALERDVDNFCGAGTPFDDIAVVVTKRL